MKSKRGFLLGEYTLKVIIAVICILLLIYLLYSIYSSFRNEKDLMRAESTLNSISETIELAKSSGEAQTFILLEPYEWAVVSFVGDVAKPDSCLETQNCICVCRLTGGRTIAKTELDYCRDTGICKNFDDGLNEFEYAIRDKPKILWVIPRHLGLGAADELEITYGKEGIRIVGK
jgi:hypothetical protein